MPHGLLPQDVVVLAKLICRGDKRQALAQLASELHLSPSQIHLSLKRLERSRLIADAGKDRKLLLRPVEEFLVHGVKYAFPAQRGEPTRGVPTAHAAPPLSEQISAGSELPPVWSFPDGRVRGMTLEPLHKTVPAAAAKDPPSTRFSRWSTRSVTAVLASANSPNASLPHSFEGTCVADPNRELFQCVVRLLHAVLDELVFVGGCTTGLLVTETHREHSASPR